MSKRARFNFDIQVFANYCSECHPVVCIIHCHPLAYMNLARSTLEEKLFGSCLHLATICMISTRRRKLGLDLAVAPSVSPGLSEGLLKKTISANFSAYQGFLCESLF